MFIRFFIVLRILIELMHDLNKVKLNKVQIK